MEAALGYIKTLADVNRVIDTLPEAEICQKWHPASEIPPLHPTNIVEPTATWCPSGSYSHKHDERNKGMFTTDRAKNRAKTFTGIAKAMAEQWG